MPAKRRCPGTPGSPCPRLIPAGTRYCQACTRTRDARRGTARQRGYDTAHQRERTRLAPLVATGGYPCTRCHTTITPGTPWDLGHTDDRTGWTGPEHASCNRQAGGTRGAAATNRSR